MLESWHEWSRELDIDMLEDPTRARTAILAPIWVNKYKHWHWHRQRSTATLAHSKNPTLRRHLAASGCHALVDFITPTGSWPSSTEFLAFVKERVPSETAATRDINFLYKQLTQIVERLFPAGLPQLTRAQARAPAFPWSTWSGVKRRFFAHIRSSDVYASLLPSKLPRRTHPLLRHQVGVQLDPEQLSTTLRYLRQYTRPRVLDVTLRTWWRMLPVNYFFWRNGPPEKRLCSHDCNAVETYQHLFWDCRIARDAWTRTLALWRPLLYAPPTWLAALFGIHLVTPPHDRRTRPATLTLADHTQRDALRALDNAERGEAPRRTAALRRDRL